MVTVRGLLSSIETGTAAAIICPDSSADCAGIHLVEECSKTKVIRADLKGKHPPTRLQGYSDPLGLEHPDPPKRLSVAFYRVKVTCVCKQNKGNYPYAAEGGPSERRH